MTFPNRNDGAAIRQWRERRNVSLRRLAREAGISAAYLSDIELGRRKLNEHTAKKINAAKETTR